MSINNLQVKNLLVINSLKQLKISLQTSSNLCKDCKWACEYIDYILNIIEEIK